MLRAFSTAILATMVFLTQASGSAGQQLRECSSYLSFHGVNVGELKTFASHAEAESMAHRIVSQVGLAPNFVIRAGTVANAAAIVCSDTGGGRRQRYIVYNQGFMDDISRRTANYWSLISILAHEIGHHANSHILAGGSSGHKAELEADYFSGFVLARMNAGLQDALAAMRALGSSGPSSSHPDTSERLVAIESGWRQGRGLLGPSGPAASRAVFRHLANTYVEGEGFRTLRGASPGDCAEACQADRRCAMYELYKPERKCNLYDHTVTAGQSINADVGIKQGGGDTRVSTGRFSEHPRTYVDGDGYEKQRRSSLEACRGACDQDQRCRMFEFYKPDSTCNLYTHTRTAGGSNDAHVGIKQ